METGLLKAKIRNIDYKHDRRLTYLRFLIKLEEIEYKNALKELESEKRIFSEINKHNRITYSYAPVCN